MQPPDRIAHNPEVFTMSPLLVFDLDGTLVDSLPDITAALNRMFAARGLPKLRRDQVLPMVGDGVEPLIARAFAAQGAPPDRLAATDYVREYEAKVLVDTRLFDGIATTIEILGREGWRFAVCTNKPARAARKLLEGLGLTGRFASVGGGDSFATRKPDPLHLTETIRAANGEASGSIMVGDHQNDIAAARGAGVKSIFAGWGYGQTGMEAGADAVCRDADGLANVAKSLLAQAA